MASSASRSAISSRSIEPQVEDVLKRRLDLRGRVGLDRVDRNVVRRDLLELGLLFAFERFEREHDVGIVPFARDRGVDAQIVDRALDLVARDAVREDRQRSCRASLGARRSASSYASAAAAASTRCRLPGRCDLAAGCALADLGLRLSSRAAARRSTSATFLWIARRSRSWISITTSKVGGALRSSTVLRVPRRRASSSESVTALMPPTRSDSVGFISRFSSVWPCAVPISVHAALGDRARGDRFGFGADLVDDDDFGMWFSTASIMTACCSAGIGDLHAPREADARDAECRCRRRFRWTCRR